MSTSIQSVLHSEASAVGLEKKKLLTENTVIAAIHSEEEPKFRTRWEDILKFGEIGLSMFAEAMKKAAGGDLPASQLENEQVKSFVLEFCVAQARALAAVFSNYDPKCGFDLDLAIIVGDMFEYRSLEVYCEVFPRPDEHRMVVDFGSTIIYRRPLRVSADEMGGEGVIVTPIVGLLREDQGSDILDAPQLAHRISRWYQHTKGIWPVRGEFLTNYFLNRTLSSIMLAGGEEVKAAGVHRSFDGVHSDATFDRLRLY